MGFFTTAAKDFLDGDRDEGGLGDLGTFDLTADEYVFLEAGEADVLA